MTGENCGTCRFWHDDGTEGDEVSSPTYCRRFPPKARDGHTSIFPYVPAEGWCGEWRIAVKPDEARSK